MKITVTTEFDSVPAAAAFLARIAGEEKIIDAVIVEPTKTVAEKPARKPRADAGQKREPYGPRATTTGEPAASEPGVVGQASAAPQQPAAPATPTPSSAPQEPKSAADGQSVPPAAAAEDFPATLDGARKAMAALNKTKNKGMDACIAALKASGVNRISDLPKEKYADFIKSVIDQASKEGIAEAIAEYAAKAPKK